MEPKFGTGHAFVGSTVSTSTQCLVEALGLGSGHHPRKKLSGSPTTAWCPGQLTSGPGVVFEPHTSVTTPALQVACCFPSEASCLQGLASESTRKTAKDPKGPHGSACEAAERCDSCSAEPVSGPVSPGSLPQRCPPVASV